MGRPRKPLELARATMRRPGVMADGRKVAVMHQPMRSNEEMAERAAILAEYRRRDEERFFNHHGVTWEQWLAGYRESEHNHSDIVPCVMGYCPAF